MKIEAITISNFRGIKEVNLNQLNNIVIIAGQNGSGKSCIFDAIRLLKSTYGGYQHNEWQQWMGEFQINLTNRSSDFKPMFNDPSNELRISCDFKLSQEERGFIQSNADDLLREKIWRTILPDAYSWGGLRMASFAAQFREREPEVASRVESERPILISELARPVIRGECIIPVGGIPLIVDSIALSVIFSTFRPQNIGVIDFHGAQRHYGRENVQGINLNLDANEQQQSQSALYNYANKYNNVKSEMASSYVKEVLAEKAGVPMFSQSTLTNTLTELFETFFPDKEFLGPKPTIEGGLSFPVKTGDGNLHDLDELSAGEKEILYGYLRIRNSAPKHSIILLDEPELHLNPRLIRGLPQFYKKNLGEELDNQIWLVTHSDALLREVIGLEKYNVFHMLPCSSVPINESQLKPLSASADLDIALVDLVGDLAAYRPGGKIVIFEGGGDSDFDQKMVSTLFPDLLKEANLISGSNKVRVRALHETLEKASEKNQLPFKYYSITDSDTGSKNQDTKSNKFTWDVYHIENYFLEPKYIIQVLESLEIDTTYSEEVLWDKLRECARETMPQLIRHHLVEFANNEIVQSIDLGADPTREEISSLINSSVARSIKRINKLRETTLANNAVSEKEQEVKQKYEESLTNGNWLKEYRGRDILKRFVGKHSSSVSYEVFRNLILSKMRDDGYKPKGMSNIIYSIVND